MTRPYWLLVLIAVPLHLFLLCLPLIVLGEIGQVLAAPQIVLFLCLITGWLLLEGSTNPIRKQPSSPTTGPQWLPLMIGLVILMTFWVSITENAFRSNIPPLKLSAIAGSLAMIAGIVLRYLSIRTLGSYFLDEIALLPQHPLVTHGVYRWMRHPSEMGTLCLVFGSVGLLGSGWGLVACSILLVPAVAWRIFLEEALLRQRHPQAFSIYTQKVPALFPWLRRFRYTKKAHADTDFSIS